MVIIMNNATLSIAPRLTDTVRILRPPMIPISAYGI